MCGRYRKQKPAIWLKQYCRMHKGLQDDDDRKKIDVGFNIPPFLEGKGQFHPKAAFEGRNIASLRNHIDRENKQSFVIYR